jgi:hypothetical protein
MRYIVFRSYPAFLILLIPFSRMDGHNRVGDITDQRTPAVALVNWPSISPPLSTDELYHAASHGHRGKEPCRCSHGALASLNSWQAPASRNY